MQDLIKGLTGDTRLRIFKFDQGPVLGAVAVVLGVANLTICTEKHKNNCHICLMTNL